MKDVKKQQASADYYRKRHHPQYKLSKANIKLYNLILGLDVETIFEFGCGIGRHLSRLNDLGYKTRGIDISPECINEAKGDKLKASVGGVETLKKFKQHDLVFTNSVLCHMEDIEEAKIQLKRMAKKYLIAVECVTKTNDFWWVHEYEGELIDTIDSHLSNGAIYNIYLLKI